MMRPHRYTLVSLFTAVLVAAVVARGVTVLADSFDATIALASRVLQHFHKFRKINGAVTVSVDLQHQILKGMGEGSTDECKCESVCVCVWCWWCCGVCIVCLVLVVLWCVCVVCVCVCVCVCVFVVL